MKPDRGPAVVLRPWMDGDLPLLHRLLGDPAMMDHLGGPETPEQIEQRHGRYLAMKERPEAGEMLVMLMDGQPAGSIGYWVRDWQGQQVWETGWSVLPQAQGRGVAKAGVTAMLERTRGQNRHRFMHAFPSVDNAPSNGLCRRLGFRWLGAVDFEYPRGHTMRCNDWVYDLGQSMGG